jgi:hypothetical protein
MPNTTNYNWVTPADSDLVKDGAAAIRTLGSSIDSTLKTQVDNTVASSIQKSVITTTGDVIYASGANTPARLGIGTNGQVLQVSAGLPAWGTAPSGGMTLISTTTLSGASVTLSSIPQTYNNLYLVFRNFLPTTDGEDIRIRINGDTGFRYANTSGTTTSISQWLITGSQDNAVTQSWARLDLWDYTNTATWKVGSSVAFTNSASAPTTSVNMSTQPTLLYNQTGAITSILIYSGSANMTSGTVLLYGVK